MYASLKSWRPNRWRGAFAALIAIFFLSIGTCVAAEQTRAPATTRAASEEARIPFKRSEESTGSLVLRIVVGLFVTILIGIGALYVVKRYFPSVYGQLSPTGGRVQVLETRRLTPKTTLFLIEYDGHRLLLGQSGETLVTLHHQSIGSSDKPHV